MKSPDGRRYVVRASKDPKRDNRDLSETERARLLHRNFDLTKPRSLLFELSTGHIGDTVIAFEAVLALRAYLKKKTKARFEFQGRIDAPKRRFFERFLKLVPIFDRVGIRSEAPRFPPLKMETLHKHFRVEFLSMGSHWDFYWAMWGLPGKYRPVKAPLERFRRQARKEFSSVRGKLGLPGDRGFVFFFPESSPLDGTHKLWPMSNWIELVLRTLDSTSHTILICSHRAEFRELARRDPRVVIFDPEEAPVRADFFTLAMLVENADAIVSVDTGPAHVAGMLNRRCITLFGPTNPGFEGHRNNMNIRVSSCPPCGWKVQSQFCINNICMKEILPRDISELLNGALKGNYEPC
ncbi:MAG: glycosyltransferase family 9 protein [Bdellovibrionota bacterium]